MFKPHAILVKAEACKEEDNTWFPLLTVLQMQNPAGSIASKPILTKFIVPKRGTFKGRWRLGDDEAVVPEELLYTPGEVEEFYAEDIVQISARP